MNAIAQASAGPVSGSKLDNRRVLAALIDLAVVAVGAAVIMAAAGVLGDSPSQMGGGLTLVTLGWALYYYFACESGNGQTLGKRVTNIRVVRTDGSPAGVREIGIRTVLRVIDGVFLYLVGLIVMISTGERRGRLGDLAGDTMIVSADTPVAPTAAPEAGEAMSRVPIAESGPAFAPEVEEEPAALEDAEPEVASPALESLAADVSAVTTAPDRVGAEEPEAEEEPVAQEPVAQAEADDEPAAQDEPDEEDEPAAAEAELDEPVDDEVTVKSVETVSAIDLVMEDSRREA